MVVKVLPTPFEKKRKKNAWRRSDEQTWRVTSCLVLRGISALQTEAWAPFTPTHKWRETSETRLAIIIRGFGVKNGYFHSNSVFSQKTKNTTKPTLYLNINSPQSCAYESWQYLFFKKNKMFNKCQIVRLVDHATWSINLLIYPHRQK